MRGPKFGLTTLFSATLFCVAADAASVSEEPSATFEGARLEVADGVIHYFLESDDFVLPPEKLAAWLERSAQAVAGYFGRFPVKKAMIMLIPGSGGGVKTGKTFGFDTATINVYFGREATEEDLKSDWIMVHEMVHLAFPSVPERHTWIEEGIAVYVESVARANAGYITPEFVWGGFVRGMPHGLPRAGDRGLDHTPTWGRTYWGGALFCLLADIEIRERTDNRFTLRDALRALVDAGTTIEKEMPLAEALEIADQAIGAPVLTENYEQARATPVTEDLDALWRRLGVEVNGDTVSFNDNAPLAAIRRQITASPPAALGVGQILQ